MNSGYRIRISIRTLALLSLELGSSVLDTSVSISRHSRGRSSTAESFHQHLLRQLYISTTPASKAQSIKLTSNAPRPFSFIIPSNPPRIKSATHILPNLYLSLLSPSSIPHPVRQHSPTAPAGANFQHTSWWCRYPRIDLSWIPPCSG